MIKEKCFPLVLGVLLLLLLCSFDSTCRNVESNLSSSSQEVVLKSSKEDNDAQSNISQPLETNEKVPQDSFLTNLDEQECGLPQCFLKDTSFGRPIVLIGLGRSGSTALSSVMSNMFVKHEGKSRNHQFKEDIGGNPSKIKRVFDKLDALHPEKPGKCWLVEILCRNQRKNVIDLDDKSLHFDFYGTQWKPNRDAMENTKAGREAVAWMQESPHIKVIYYKRNPLDRLISCQKFLQSNKQLHSNCKADDQECLEQQQKAASGLVLDESKLLYRMKYNHELVHDVVDYLDHHLPRRIDVSYESLFLEKDDTLVSSQWMRLLDYLELVPRGGERVITRETVGHYSQIVPSTNRDRSKRVQNYNAVVKLLTGTEYEEYLTV